ncbi:MAG TPA: glycosyltransferase, partial [Steroidobacteraceae bacterium]|nr:glycosyltransferase [Steroidobacteraceae bacterium]
MPDVVRPMAQVSVDTVTFAYAAAAVPLLIWLYLLFARGGFWRVSEASLQPPPPAAAPRIALAEAAPATVIAVVPARNEAAGIGKAVSSLLMQRMPVPLQVVVVDDGSTDE